MNQKFYTAFGCLASEFARLEADLRFLLAGLAFGGRSVVAAVFLDGSQLGENLRKLRKLGRQYWNEKNVFADIAGRIEKIRQTRNLFVHGLWNPRDFGEKEGVASVTDVSTCFEENESRKKWTFSQEYEFSMEDFRKLLAEVGQIRSEISELGVRLCGDEMCLSYIGSILQYKPVTFSADSDGFLGLSESDEVAGNGSSDE